jgi:hypothetical protein
MWSAWIERLFIDYKGVYSFRTMGTDDTTHQWKSRAIDLKAHVVCEECNSTWMSAVDEEAKKTMKDMIRYAGWVSLLPKGIASIAVFAFKTAVVADHVRPKRKPFFSPASRRRFATTREIPHGVQMWLGLFRGKHLLSGRYTTHYARINTGRFRGHEIYIFTYVAGYLALQVTAFRWASIVKKPPYQPVLTQNPEWAKASIPLWPSDGRACPLASTETFG